MAKQKTAKKETQVTPEPNGQGPSLPPYVVPHLVAQRVWEHLPAYFLALKSIQEEQMKTNTLLIEIRDALKEK